MNTTNPGLELNMLEFNSQIDALIAEDIKERKAIAQYFHNKKSDLTVLLLYIQTHKLNVKSKKIKPSDYRL